MGFEKLFLVEWFGALAFALVFGALSYVAFSEGNITVGGKTGTHHLKGPAAVRAAFLYLAIALAAHGYLAKPNRFRSMLWAALTLIWLCAVVTYLITR